MYNHHESFFSGISGLDIFFQSWHPDGKSLAVLAIFHGLGEHGGRYLKLAEYLTAHGLAVYAVDLTGHGRSGGRRGYITSWEDLRRDLRTFVQSAIAGESGTPAFLMGHSLGGLIALEYCPHHPEGLRGAIISAPALMDTTISPFKKTLARLLGRIYPTFTLATGLDVSGISRIAQVVEAYRADPLCHDRGTAGLGVEVFKAQDRTIAGAQRFPLPLLMIHGEADRLVPVEASRMFFERTQQADKQLIVYPGGFHEPHNDLHQEQVFADIYAWITAHR